MNKIVKNILISGTVIGVGAALIKLSNKKNKEVNKTDEVDRKYYELGADDAKRKYIKLGEINLAKVEKLADEIEVKEKKLTRVTRTMK